MSSYKAGNSSIPARITKSQYTHKNREKQVLFIIILQKHNSELADLLFEGTIL